MTTEETSLSTTWSTCKQYQYMKKKIKITQFLRGINLQPMLNSKTTKRRPEP